MKGDSPRLRSVDTATASFHDRMRRLRSGRSRAGLTILESVTALFVLGVAFTAAVQLLAGAARQLRRLEDRDRATLAASNVLERLMHTSLEMPDASQVAANGEWNWPEPPPLLASLPNARIVVETTPATPVPMVSAASPDAAQGDAAQGAAASGNTAQGKLVSRRIRVSVVGPGKQGEREVYASLTAWRFSKESTP
jgi:Tfp pilus assembly protein PilV